MRLQRPRPATALLVVLASLALHALLAVSVLPAFEGTPAGGARTPAAAASAMQVRRVEVPVSPRPPPAEAPVPAAPRPAAPTAAAPPAATVPAPPPAARPPVYFETDDVDVPAMPQPDWNIDSAGLAKVGVKRLSFEVFVDRNGIPQHCAVLSMEPLLQESWPSISAQLCRTRLSPAMRRGEAVPNVRRIELETGG